MSYLESLFSLQDKTAVCTGPTRGIGAALALALAKAGADLILIQRDVSNSATRDAARALGRNAEIVVCDLADVQAVRGLVKRITSSGQEIDILVNSGGIQRRSPAEDFSDQDWEDVLQVNLNAVFTLARDVGRHMLQIRAETGADQEPAHSTAKRSRGKIVNIASLLSYQGGFTVPAYAAAKHGVLGLTKALSNEWASKSINVNAIAPGYVATDMNQALIANPVRSRQILERIPAQRWGSPADFEGTFHHTIWTEGITQGSPASDYVNGECITCDGGWMGR